LKNGIPPFTLRRHSYVAYCAVQRRAVTRVKTAVHNATGKTDSVFARQRG